MMKPGGRVLISGASVAGPSLAYWLERYGFEVTVVEKAVAVRGGGQTVDFKGRIHLAVLRRMGILDAVRRANVPSRDGIIVNARGRRIGVVPGRFAGGDINIPRGDLATILYDRTATTCEYIFGDSIAALEESEHGVEVTFTHAGTRTFDIVVGADGIHSTVRRLAFGPESDHVKHLGYYYALARLDAGQDDVMYNEPGRMAALGGAEAPAFFVFAADPLPPVHGRIDIQKRQLIEAYRGSRWRVPALMAQIPDAEEFYMDSISRVTTDRYARGRFVLVGDAACGNALGGFGTGLAVVGAYVLAGEMLRAGRDHTVAFARYERTCRAYASTSQKINAGCLLAPSTRCGIGLRNLLFCTLSAFGPLMTLVERPATHLDLDDYGAGA